MTVLEKKEIARMQLDRAIALYLDQKDFVCAITLARASHELLRQSGVSVTGSRDSTVDEYAALVVSIAAQDREPIAAGDVIKGIFGVPNQLKHHSSESQAVVDANWCEEAREKIELAVSTWFGVYQTMTQAMVRFDQSPKA